MCLRHPANKVGRAPPRAVELPSGAVVTFAYTCDHWRVSRDDGFENVGFQWDKNNLLAETDELGDVQVQYTNEPRKFGNLVSQRREDETTYYCTVNT